MGEGMMAEWTPAVNQHDGFRRWDFVEVVDQWDAVKAIRHAISSHREGEVSQNAA